MILSIFFDTLFVITSILHAIYNYIPFQKIQKQKFLVILYYITINTWQKINTPRESVRISHCISGTPSFITPLLLIASRLSKELSSITIPSPSSKCKNIPITRD